MLFVLLLYVHFGILPTATDIQNTSLSCAEDDRYTPVYIVLILRPSVGCRRLFRSRNG